MTDFQVIISQEVWKEIPGYPGYEVSNFGRMRSWRHKNGRRIRPLILKLNDVGRYYMVQLYINGTCYSKGVHNLVLTAFVGPCPLGMECCHNDGYGHNNFLLNLRWDTRKNNSEDRIKHGTQAMGEKQGMSKLTNKDIMEIRKSSKHDVELSKIYNVDRTTIKRARRRETWKHLL